MKFALSARAQAIIVLALVATASALIGILADRLIAQQNAVEPPAMQALPPGRTPGGGGIGRGQLRFMEMLGNELELTSAQRATIDSILEMQRLRVHELQQEMQPRFRQLAEQTRRSIDRVLTDEQRLELRRLRQAQLRQERLRLRDGRPAGEPRG